MPAADVAVKCAKQAHVDTPIPQAHRRSGEISAAERKTTPPEKARRHSGINRQFAREPRNSERNPQFGRECAIRAGTLQSGQTRCDLGGISAIRKQNRDCEQHTPVRTPTRLWTRVQLATMCPCRSLPSRKTRQYATRACAQPAPTGNKARSRRKRRNRPEAVRKTAENVRKPPKSRLDSRRVIVYVQRAEREKHKSPTAFAEGLQWKVFLKRLTL